MRSGQNANRPSTHRKAKRTIPVLLAVILVLCTIGVTLALLVTTTDPLVNTFTPSMVSCEVTEDFNGSVKSNVNARNTGIIDAYLRIRLVTYRVNDDGARIGGTATIPTFTLGANWVKDGNYYYYTLPVAPEQSPSTDLTDEIALASYDDADGGKQVIEVMAEAIQSEPQAAVNEAWGVSIAPNSVTPYSAGN